MRISKISVKKLFGVFNHVIPLNRDERITIIHGPNGVGKTFLLKMTDCLFNARYSEFFHFPFQEFSVELSDDRKLTVKKRNTGKKTQIDVHLGDEKHSLSSDNFDSESFLRFRPKTIEVFESEGLIPISPGFWRSRLSGEEFSDEEALQRFGDDLPPYFTRGEGRKSLPDWLKKIHDSVKVHFVETQRLFTADMPRNSRRRYPQATSLPVSPTVAIHADELLEKIRERRVESTNLSQQLDRTFPARLLKGVQEESPLTERELEEKLKALERKRQNLADVALYEDKGSPVIASDAFLNKATEKYANVLALYIKDEEEKLGVFDDLAKKITLFKNIINERFDRKELIINREKGITFKTSDGQELSGTKLSSGEQHEFVLLYELLFKVRPDSLILIDEPEISLHIAWQKRFLKDLQDIIKLSPLDFLIATHSPDIISDRWDLTVALGGSEK
jgi:predicted ATP-binding protein involved in virulence